jgi:hypothetical protein
VSSGKDRYARGHHMGLLWNVIETRESTWTEFRAAFHYGNGGRTFGSPEQRQKAEQIFRSLAESSEHNDFTNNARIAIGLDDIIVGDIEKGKAILQRIPKSDQKRHALAQRWINQADDPDSDFWKAVRGFKPGAGPKVGKQKVK